MKIIQIATGVNDQSHTIYALTDDGRLWYRTDSWDPSIGYSRWHWEELSGPPAPAPTIKKKARKP